MTRDQLSPREIIDRAASGMQLPKIMREEAQSILAKAQKRDLTVGWAADSVAGACLYLAGRVWKTQRTLFEICNAIQAPERKVGRLTKKFARELDIKAPLITASDLVPRMCSDLKLSPPVQGLAMDVLKRVPDSRSSGMLPQGLAAFAIYVASILKEERRTQRECADVGGSTEVTIRNHLVEFVERQGAPLHDWVALQLPLFKETGQLWQTPHDPPKPATLHIIGAVENEPVFQHAYTICGRFMDPSAALSVGYKVMDWPRTGDCFVWRRPHKLSPEVLCGGCTRRICHRCFSPRPLRAVAVEKKPVPKAAPTGGELRAKVVGPPKPPRVAKKKRPTSPRPQRPYRKTDMWTAEQRLEEALWSAIASMNEGHRPSAAEGSVHIVGARGKVDLENVQASATLCGLKFNYQVAPEAPELTMGALIALEERDNLPPCKVCRARIGLLPVHIQIPKPFRTTDVDEGE